MKNLTIKELFVIFIPLSLFVSTFFLIRVLGNAFGEPSEIFYMGPIFFTAISLFTVVMAYAIFSVMKKAYTNTTHVRTGTTILIVLFIYYNSAFIHPANVGVFFANLYIPSLFINAVFTLLVAIVIHKIIRRKFR